ncbi:MAG: P-loop NTPase [Planctomycetes bacterium]|nr:P-loop NTPase [Planctomycetota bacterium]
MKICICGKGGSGKSTVVALLAAELQRRGKRVLVVDSDESNAGLYWMLGLDEPPNPLMELAGGKKSIQRVLRTGFTEDADDREKSVLARDEFRTDELPDAYVQWADGVGLVCIGKIHQALEGCACPMGVLSREFLKKVRTDDDEVVVVDMEAGVEHFGRGVETSVDAVMVVAEPSLESVTLAERIKALASQAGARFAGAVLNKVSSEKIGAQLRGALERRGVQALSAIPFRQEFLLGGLEGKALNVEPVADEVRSFVDSILAVAEAPKGN